MTHDTLSFAARAGYDVTAGVLIALISLAVLFWLASKVGQWFDEGEASDADWRREEYHRMEMSYPGDDALMAKEREAVRARETGQVH